MTAMKRVVNCFAEMVLNVWNFIFPSYGRTVYANILKTQRIVNKNPNWKLSKGVSMTNPDRSHAKEGIQKMLNSANERIYILCHRLNQDVYDDYNTVRALNSAYERNPELEVKVFLRKTAPYSSAFLTTLVSYGATIYDELDKEESLQEVLANGDIFLVDDGRFLRREVNQDKKQGQLYFADGEEAERAEMIFNKLIFELRNKAPLFEKGGE